MKKVDYRSIAKDDKFKAYVQHTAELQRVQIKDATRQEKLAFFINIYNALVIHAFVIIGPPVNLWQRYKVGAILNLSWFLDLIFYGGMAL